MKERSITKEKIQKERSIIKSVDKGLLAERIAIEVKAHMEVFGYFHPVFRSYLITAKDDIMYSEKEKEEILNMAKSILKTRYHITVISDSPFECRIDESRNSKLSE